MTEVQDVCDVPWEQNSLNVVVLRFWRGGWPGVSCWPQRTIVIGPDFIEIRHMAVSLIAHPAAAEHFVRYCCFARITLANWRQPISSWLALLWATLWNAAWTLSAGNLQMVGRLSSRLAVCCFSWLRNSNTNSQLPFGTEKISLDFWWIFYKKRSS